MSNPFGGGRIAGLAPFAFIACAGWMMVAAAIAYSDASDDPYFEAETAASAAASPNSPEWEVRFDAEMAKAAHRAKMWAIQAAVALVGAGSIVTVSVVRVVHQSCKSRKRRVMMRPGFDVIPE